MNADDPDGARQGSAAWPSAKAATGISGLDELLNGGLPHGQATLLVGGPGTGKTVLALETLVHGARSLGEPGIFVALEESSAQIRRNAASFGWDLPGLEDDRLLFVDARLPVDVYPAGDYDLAGLLSDLRVIAREMGARRVAFDGLEALLLHMEDPAAERRERYRVCEWISEEDLVGLITEQAEWAGVERGPRYRYLPYAASVVIRLDQRLTEAGGERLLQVVKYRGSAYLQGAYLFAVEDAGIRVDLSPAQRRRPRAAEQDLERAFGPALQELVAQELRVEGDLRTLQDTQAQSMRELERLSAERRALERLMARHREQRERADQA